MLNPPPLLLDLLSYFVLSFQSGGYFYRLGRLISQLQWALAGFTSNPPVAIAVVSTTQSSSGALLSKSILLLIPFLQMLF